VRGSQTIPADIEQLANEASKAIIDHADSVAAAEGEFALVAHREADRFGRLHLKATTRILPPRQHLSSEQLNRLAAHAGAKILSEADQLGATVRVITLRFHSRGDGYSIGLGIEF
jgi:hypothetical protein